MEAQIPGSESLVQVRKELAAEQMAEWLDRQKEIFLARRDPALSVGRSSPSGYYAVDVGMSFESNVSATTASWETATGGRNSSLPSVQKLNESVSFTKRLPSVEELQFAGIERMLQRFEEDPAKQMG